MDLSVTAVEALRPPKPDDLAALDISPSLVQDLFLRSLREERISSLGALRERLKLPVPVLESLFRQLRQQQLLDVKGMSGMDYSFSLSQAGRVLAAERASVSGYVGPAPVSLSAY